MPVGISRLRLAGFKSFAEPTVMEIRAGLTGIVGPNGCGKSNVVEALRWVMGESSARSLRGGEMDDVIFAGTNHRPARTLAEVTLTLDAGAERFPIPFEEQAELEIGRRIERGGGSAYRVNGKDARARDVQTLFADLSSGARASAMVSQGRVGALVAARPDERRAILEEAAGIGGLHARRHEAELKLRAADANLQRAEDLRTQLTTQLAAVQKQAKQAARYHALSTLVRAAEIDLLSVQAARTTVARAAAAAALHACQTGAASAQHEAREAEHAADQASAALPPLREHEAAARTTLERARIAREQIEAEAARAAATLAALRDALARLARDHAHATQLGQDAAAAEQRLAGEAHRLSDDLASHPAEAAAATAACARTEAARGNADARLHTATETAAGLAARAQALSDTLGRATHRLRKLDSAIATQAQERSAITLIPMDQVQGAAREAEAAAAAAITAEAALEHAAAARQTAAAALDAARSRLHQAEPAHARLLAETGALAEILGVHTDSGATRLVDLLRVPPGMEAAIGAAFGEDLELPADEAAPRHMRALAPLGACPALPEAARPLAAYVEAPAALHRALSQIGLVAAEHGAALQPGLHPGQSLVGAEGQVWRWDGYTQAAAAPTAAAIRLRQRNRLTDLRTRLAEAERSLVTARLDHDAVTTAARNAAAAEAAAQAASRAAEQRAATLRRDCAALQHRAETAATRIAALDTQRAATRAEHDEAAAECETARAAAAALPPVAIAKAEVGHARATLDACRTAEQTARAQVDQLQRQASARQSRLRAIMADRAGWADRARDATMRLADLDARIAETTDTERTLAAEPDRLDQARQDGQAALAAATQAARLAAATLAAAEREAAACEQARRAAVIAQATAREAALRAEADARGADHDWGTVAERILERLGAHPDLPPQPDPSAETEDRARRKSDRLTREREEMGPVNLCAEAEAAEIAARLAAIDTDRDELAAAINKLRGSIGHLNREGRERLAAVFAEVDRHFQQLFTRMFGGGRAQLALVGSDDPLQAGLEIYAQPPGKKLATLSLLSGGEQALTALSLIFAVFRCNPAPICVLDEVDAPLDDANIDRFCSLLADMVTETGTRFLVVTHHHVTMARMDRLYGVTMVERGVSRLLSVDLTRATEITTPLRMAAE